MNYKPFFHITADKGWINDPNGLIKFKDEYHIFFQHHPYSCEWGPMHWGHVVSKDLKSFSYLPYALTPGDACDKDGCFSGSSLIKDDTLYVAYTGFFNNKDPEEVRQIQCLASSKDGIHFEKHGIIIDTKDIPVGYKLNDFRDPKIFFKDGNYYILVAAKKLVGNGSILCYKSKDLKKWEFVSDVLTHDIDGRMVECPDYHEDLNLLIYSETDFPSENPHCLNLHSCEYEIGLFDKSFKFQSKGKQLLDYGFDFYAPQLFANENILIGWMNMWGRTYLDPEHGFVGMLSVPRKLEVKDNMLLQTPLIYGDLIEEVEAKENITHLVAGTVVLEVEDLQELDATFRVGEDECTHFFLKGREFYFDRSKSGKEIKGEEKDELSLKGMRKMPYVKKDKDIIYFVLDKYSLEIFVNGISMTNLIYPKETSDLLKISTKSKETKFKIYECKTHYIK